MFPSCIFTFPPLEYIAVPAVSTSIVPSLSTEFPKIPILFFDTFIVPLFLLTSFPKRSAVYIPIVGVFLFSFSEFIVIFP